MPNRLTITNQKGATIRTAAGTGAGIIRPAANGTVLDYQFILNAPNGDQWALLTSIDPVTNREWRFGGDRTFAYVAVYVNGVNYADLQPDPTTPTDKLWNELIDKLITVLQGMKK
jgi:hypothetical protein